MTPIEFTISLLAPDRCLVCKREGLLVCRMCAGPAFTTPPPACFRCRSYSTGSATCLRCSEHTFISNFWAASYYEGSAKELLGLLKFQRAKAAATAIARFIDTRLPALPGCTLVSAVPTANARVRARGYDQSYLIAHALARIRKLPYRETLIRSGSTRQVGSSRSQRLQHLKNAYSVRKPASVIGTTILLVDDVITTGATLEAAARELHLAGAKTVFATVFAQANSTAVTGSSLDQCLPEVPKVLENQTNDHQIPHK